MSDANHTYDSRFEERVQDRRLLVLLRGVKSLNGAVECMGKYVQLF